MNYLDPIYTEKNDCQDCYKCVRMCPVKSIKVEEGSAAVIYEKCITCGICVDVCPAGAKKVRNDLDKVKQLLKLKEKVIVSLAPSFHSEFPHLKPEQLIKGIKKLGFYAVSETALGAQEVTSNCASILNNSKGKIYFSSACPSVNEYVKKYYPEYTKNITELYSPLLSHSVLLRKYFDENISVVFIGPCISKKIESDNFPQLLDASLTFEDLKHWFEDSKIYPEFFNSDDEKFIPYNANEGTLYPIEGGMNEGIKYNLTSDNTTFMQFSGVSSISKALSSLNKIQLDEQNIFIEMLACEGGCVNGPKVSTREYTALKRVTIDKQVNRSIVKPMLPALDIKCTYLPASALPEKYSDQEIEQILFKIGKHNKKDELNCAGCGYNTCRDFAISILEDKSEEKMCVTYMRQLAQKKANALIKTMPSGIVIVDEKLKIVESNHIWASLMGEETEMLFDVKPGMEGADLKKIFPFFKLFQNVLETGEDIVAKEIEFNNTILLFSIFTIEKHRFAGGIFRDITEPWVRKDQIINKAKEVIKKNLSTVQKIAYLLGENASETEVMLNGIIDSFTKDKIDENNL